ncbi:unnamed protein product [Mytilus coruscus]|uniref:Integrase zinc-binding domain-containing protein n=1 Tax=Mytilus coruscus TaxID=42192 RepID=A0A6J8BJ34_MYTCO|nr:unnamed protein product [Mytilus coruscus]
MKRPETVTQVRSFLGLASYYRKYVKDFSKIAKPLFDLTKKNQKFAWNKDAEAAFLGLKRKSLNFKLDKIEKPAWEEICGYGLNLKFWLAKWELLEIRNNVLCLKWVERAQQARWKICVPESLVDPILWYLHDARTGAHLGIKKTYEKAKLSPSTGEICRDPLSYIYSSAKYAENAKARWPRNVIR